MVFGQPLPCCRQVFLDFSCFIVVVPNYSSTINCEIKTTNSLVRSAMNLVAPLSRRKLLGAGAALLASPPLLLRAQTTYSGTDPATTQGFWERDRWVWLYRPATQEQVKLVYWRDGQLLQDAYLQLSWFMRDVRFEKMLASNDKKIYTALNHGLISEQHMSPWVLMDPVLLDILYAYCAWLAAFGIGKPLLMTSGFRHLVTNMMTEGAARNSSHMKGGASDIVVSGVSPVALAKFGLWLSGGGVGLYASRGFIHVDRGRVRSWTG